MTESKLKKFQKLLSEKVVDLEALRELSWTGIPPSLRPLCWQLLLGYLPANKDNRDTVIERKRREYRDLIPQYYDVAHTAQFEDELGALRQVAVDVPRTAPGVAFFHLEPVQRSLERILYIWGVKHPASGYVQGINDLVTPLLAVFMSQHCSGPMEGWQLSDNMGPTLMDIEADSYWCLCKMLDSIQDHYTYAQPGIQRTVFHLKELVRRIEEPVAAHVEEEGVEFLQFAFRWVNCLLIREVPFPMAIRLWDTYLAEGPQLREFLTYVLAAFFLHWSDQLKGMDFQEMILYLQKLPTGDWTEREVELILSKAYMWRASFGNAKSHLGS